MRLRVEVTDELSEDEIVIRCGRADGIVEKIRANIAGMSSPKLKLYKGAGEYYLPPETIFFFETDGETVYAHTASDAFQVRRRLYELESILPRFFARASKGVIVNTARIFSITRNLTSSSKIEFRGTHKHVYVSRHYYKTLKDKLSERSE
jgi:DNA-binding LytR/AlgR family response regulator